jgi:tetratricopeptide (TPR) repeat protein
LLYSESIAERQNAASEAIDVLSELIEEAPQFRHEEAVLFLALSYRSAGQTDKGMEVLATLLNERPELWTNWSFVSTAARLTPDPEGALTSWRLRELREGAKPVPKEMLNGAWGDL